MRNFYGSGKELTEVVNGESVQWTKSLRSLDTLPLRVFIIKSICSFIIGISVTMWGEVVLVMDGRLMSCRFDLLGALLPSDPSWFLRSALVPSWSSSWVPITAFFCHSYSSRSWFCLVRCSTAAVRVWTCLSKAVGRGSSPWTLLVVAIDWVNTMQLFVQEAFVWLTSRCLSHRWRQLMMPKNHQWATRPLHAQNNTCTTKREDLGWIMHTYFLRVFGFL